MSFAENWMSKNDIKALHLAMREVKAPLSKGRVIEVGSWEGKSTIQIANFFYPQVIEVIDFWGPDSMITKEVVEFGGRDVFETFNTNMKAETQGNYHVNRMNWRSYRFEEPIRFIFLDADHSYAEVFEGINAVKNLMVQGGVMAGDDFGLKSVKQGVYDTIGEVKSPNGKIWWTRT